MARLIAMSQQEEKKNNWQRKLMHDNFHKNQPCPYNEQGHTQASWKRRRYGLVKGYVLGISRNSSLFV